jgi:hypothetical protein
LREFNAGKDEPSTDPNADQRSKRVEGLGEIEPKGRPDFVRGASIPKVGEGDIPACMNQRPCNTVTNTRTWACDHRDWTGRLWSRRLRVRRLWA